MDEKYISNIYNSLGGKSVFGEYNDFSSLITSDKNYAKSVYDAYGADVFGGENDFYSLVLKKKETTDLQSKQSQKNISSESPSKEKGGQPVSSVIKNPSYFNPKIEANDWTGIQKVTQKMFEAKTASEYKALQGQLDTYKKMYGDVLINDKNISEDIANAQKTGEKLLAIKKQESQKPLSETLAGVKEKAPIPTKQRSEQEAKINEIKKKSESLTTATEDEIKNSLYLDMIQSGLTDKYRDRFDQVDADVEEAFSDDPSLSDKIQNWWNKQLISAGLYHITDKDKAIQKSIQEFKAAGQNPSQDQIIDRAKNIMKDEETKKLQNDVLADEISSNTNLVDDVKQLATMARWGATLPSEEQQKLIQYTESLKDKTKVAIEDFNRDKIRFDSLYNEVKDIDENTINQMSPDQKQATILKLNEVQNLYSDLNKKYNAYNNDSEAIKGFDEELQTLKRNYGTITNLSTKLVSSTAKIVGGVMKFQALPFETVLPKSMHKYFSNGDMIMGAADYLDSKVAEQKRIDDINSPGEFFRYSGELLAEQLPQIALAVVGGEGAALAGMATSASGQKYYELEKEEKQAGKELFTQSQKLAASVLSGVAEFASEKIQLDVLKRALPSFRLAEAARRGATQLELDVLKKEFQSGFKNGIKKVADLALIPAEEGVSEVAAQMGGNIIDRTLLGKKDVGLLDGVKDAFVSGAMMGNMLSVSPYLAAQVITPFVNDPEAQLRTNTAKLEKLSQALESADEKNKPIIQRSIDQIKDQNISIMNGGVEVMDGLTPQEIKRGVELYDEIQQIKQDYIDIKNDPNMSPEQKKATVEFLNQEYNKSVQERLSLIKKGKENAVQKKDISEESKLKLNEIAKNIEKEIIIEGKYNSYTKKLEEDLKLLKTNPEEYLRKQISDLKKSGEFPNIVNNYENLLNNLYAVQKQSTGKVSVQSETGVGQEVVEGKPQPESQIATQEGEQEEIKIHKPTIYANTKPEVDRIKSEPIEKESGQTFNLDGTVYDKGGLIVPVASKNTTQEDLTPEAIADFVEENSGKIGSQSVKVGIYKFPNSNQVSIDLNVVVPSEHQSTALEFGTKAGQESLYDLNSGENIKTGSDGKNPINFTDEQFKEISKALQQGKLPSFMAEQQKPQATTKSILGENIRKAIAKVFPDLNIVEFNNAQEMRDYVAKKYGENVAKDFTSEDAARALFKSGKIHEVLINKELADTTTMPHEVWHGILAKAFGENEKLFGEFRDAIDKALRENGYEDIADQLDAFVVNEEYISTDTMAQEWLVQFGGMLTNAGIDPKSLTSSQKSLLQQIKDIVNQFARKIIGQDVFLEDATPENILEFMTSISDSLSRGEDISGYFAQAANTQTTISEPVITKASKKIKFKEKYPLSFVTKADKIDIYEFIKKAVAEKKKIWFWVADQLGRGMYFDQVINGEHYLDAGPSFALDPENRDEGVLWATSKGEKWINDNVENSDYILFISGSSQNSKAFNIAVNDLVKKRIETSIGKLAGKTINVGSKSKSMSIKVPKGDAFESFKSVVNEILKDTTQADSFEKNLSGFKGEINRSKSFDDIFKSTLRKDFLLYINSMASKSTPLADFLNKIGATIDLNNLRDGFYLENNFELGDVMLIGKPTGFGGKSKHSTYHNNVLGEVIGVPDRKISSFDIAPTEIKEQLKKLTSTQAISKVAPYGSGISMISEPEVITRAQKVKPSENLPESVANKLTGDGKGNVVFHHYSFANRDEIKPSTGDMTRGFTSKEEAAALASVGGLAMYYAQVDQVENGVGPIRHTVLVPEGKIYYMNTDPMNFYDQARQEFMEYMNKDREKSKWINYAFSPNYQTAWITKVAIENGFEMVVSKWKNDADFRAQTTETLKASKEDIPFKKSSDVFEIGDKIFIYGQPAVITDISDNKVITFQSASSSGKFDLKSMRYGALALLDKGPYQVNEQTKEIEKVTTKAQKIDERVQKELDGIIKKSQQRGASPGKVYENALAYLQKSKMYENMSDVEREDVVRELRKQLGIKEKKAPSTNKILGVLSEVKKITMKEIKYVKDVIKAQVKGATASEKLNNDLRKQLSEEVASMTKSGKITVRQASALLKTIGKVNFKNPISVARFLEYAKNVFEKADYTEKLSEAVRIRSKISKSLKSKDIQVKVADVAKAFCSIDPKMIEDLDEYMTEAGKVLASVMPQSTEQGIRMRNAADFVASESYINKALKEQTKKEKQQLLDSYEDLVSSGIIDESMSIDDIKQIIDSIDETDESRSKEYSEQVKDFLQYQFDNLVAIARDIIDTGVDPMTNTLMDIDPAKVALIKEVLKIADDFNKLNIVDMKKTVEYLQNFVSNGITDGLEGIVSTYKGMLNARLMKESNVKLKMTKLFFSKSLGSMMAKQFTSLMLVLEEQLGGQTIARTFANYMGLNDVINGNAKARTESSIVQQEYANKFGKIKGFFNLENIIERGVVSFLYRGSDSEAEFLRRKSLVEQTIEKLKNGTEEEIKKAQIIEDIYNKIAKDKNSGQEVFESTNKDNQDAINWWINKWQEKYQGLKDVAENVYNVNLGSDLNYTPDNYSKFSEAEEEEDFFGNSAFALSTKDFTVKKRTGVLMESSRPKQLPKNRVINFEFDMNNANTYEAALVDMYTASAIRQVDGFLRSSAFESMGTKEPKDLMKSRVRGYISNIRGKNFVKDSDLKSFEKSLRKILPIGIGQALVGAATPIKQSLGPTLATLTNAGRLDIASVVDPAFNEFIMKSGYPVANRGLESVSVFSSANKLIEEAERSAPAKALSLLAKSNELMLKYLLQKPDVFTYKLAWASYYKKSLSQQGLSTDIDWSTHKLNKVAADYAQDHADRQQNVSDPFMMGDMYTSKSPASFLFKTFVMPFSNFLMNQKARMYSDMKILFSKPGTVNPLDRRNAIKSLAGLSVEMATYSTLQSLIGVASTIAVYSMLGAEPPEKEKDKMVSNAYRTFATNTVNDFLNPVPVMQTTAVMQMVINNALETAYDITDQDEKDKFYLWDPSGKEFVVTDYLGAAGITIGKLNQFYDYAKLAETGEYEIDVFGKKKVMHIKDSDREILKQYLPFAAAYSIGIGVNEQGKLMSQLEKVAKMRHKKKRKH